MCIGVRSLSVTMLIKYEELLECCVYVRTYVCTHVMNSSAVMRGNSWYSGSTIVYSFMLLILIICILLCFVLCIVCICTYMYVVYCLCFVYVHVCTHAPHHPFAYTFYSDGGSNVIWHSGPIVEREGPYRVKTKSGSIYVLNGKINSQQTIERGV